MAITFSASMLEYINSCKRSYFYKYIEKPYVRTNPYMALGILLHRMFERYYNLNFKTKESFQGQYAHEWNNVCSGESKIVNRVWVHDEEKREEILEAFLWAGYNMLGKFFDKHKEKRDELEERRRELKQNIMQKYEEEFLQQNSLFRTTKKEIRKATKGIINDEYKREKNRLFPKIEELIKFQYEGYKLLAKIDRIDILNREYYVTDNKTGKKLIEPFKNHQFTIYYLAVLDKFGKPPKAMIRSYIRLDTDQIVVLGEEHFRYLKTDLEEATRFLKEIHQALGIVRSKKRKQKKQGAGSIILLPCEEQELEIAENILDIKGFKPRQEGQCYFCDFHKLCEDQIKNRESELKKIQNANQLENKIEEFWSEIDFE